MLARRRNLMLARARRAVGRKGRVALAGALTGAGKFLSNKAQNYVRRKLTNKKKPPTGYRAGTRCRSDSKACEDEPKLTRHAALLHCCTTSLRNCYAKAFTS